MGHATGSGNPHLAQAFLVACARTRLEPGPRGPRDVRQAIASGLRSKKGQGLVWGKEARYFDERGLELVRWLATICPLHTTIGEARGYRRGMLPPNVTNHGHLDAAAWRTLLQESNFVIGLGDPVSGPTAVEALAAGCVYVNRRYATARRVNERGPVAIRSQHPALERIGPPFVWTVGEDRNAVRRAVEASLEPAATRRALARRAAGRRLITALMAFTEAAYVRRLRAILAASR
jgi:hypothetical protein